MDPHPLHRGTPPLTHPHCHAFASAIFLSRMHCFSPPIHPGASWPPVARPPAAEPPQLCGVPIPDTGEGTGRQKQKLEEISQYLDPYGKTQNLTMFLSLSSHFHGQGTVVSWLTRGPRECGWGSRWTSDLVTTGTGWPQTTESQSWQTKTSCQVGIRSLLAHLSSNGEPIISPKAQFTVGRLSKFKRSFLHYFHCPCSVPKPHWPHLLHLPSEFWRSMVASWALLLF